MKQISEILIFLVLSVIWRIFAISSRWDNEKVATPANDDNNRDAGFNDGVVGFIYLPNPPMTVTQPQG